MSVRVVAWEKDKGTHDAEVRPCRAQHLSQSSSPATNQSLLQFHSTAASCQNVNITLVFSVLALFKNCTRSIVHSHHTQSTVCAYIHINLLLICLLSPSYYYHQILLHITVLTNIANILLLLHNMLKYYYYHTICSNTNNITQYAQILLLSLHSAINPLKSTWARTVAHVVGNYMSGYGNLGSGLLHSTCTSDEIQSPIYI